MNKRKKKEGEKNNRETKEDKAKITMKTKKEGKIENGRKKETKKK